MVEWGSENKATAFSWCDTSATCTAARAQYLTEAGVPHSYSIRVRWF
jgi:hypothetical protein